MLAQVLCTFCFNLRKQEAEGKVKRIVDLDELSASVLLTNLDNPVETHKFSFDNVLWSFDGYSEQSDGYLTPDNKTVSDEIYCDQVVCIKI